MEQVPMQWSCSIKHSIKVFIPDRYTYTYTLCGKTLLFADQLCRHAHKGRSTEK